MILPFKTTIFLFFFIGQALAHNFTTERNQNTFLIKTNLTKERLEALLQEGKTKVVNLKQKQGQKEVEYNETNIVEDGDNITTEEGLNREIEDEIMDDALIPLEEFHVKEVKTSETKTFIVQKNTKIIDALYEKRFGKIYGYLTIVFFIFAVIYFSNLNRNKKVVGKNKKYDNYSEFDNDKEYMLAEFD